MHHTFMNPDQPNVYRFQRPRTRCAAAASPTCVQFTADLKDRLLLSPLDAASDASTALASHHLPTSDVTVYHSAYTAGHLKVSSRIDVPA